MIQRKLFNGYAGGNEFEIAVALGKAPGWRIFRKFGMNPDVPNTGVEEMWPPGTVRVLPTSAAVLSVVSSHADDDADPAGIGAWVVRVEGLDMSYGEITEDISLNGIGAVASTQLFLRVNRAYVLTAGTNSQNTGDISISIGGNLQAFIEATEGQTHQTHYTVPAGHTLIGKRLTEGCGRMTGTSDLHILTQIKIYNGDTAWRTLSDIYLFNGGSEGVDEETILVPEKSEMRQQIRSTSVTQTYGIITGYLMENKVHIDDT